MRACLASLLLFFAPGFAAFADGLTVVAPRAFADALGDFVAFKKTRLRTELVFLEDILASSPGTDDAEKLKRFLYEKWRAEKPAFVLLAGDADVLPVRYMVLDRITPAAFDYSFYPSDLYYADLAKADGSFEDWNAQREGFHARYFGEVRGEKNKGDAINFDGIDYLPDVAVGRWPVSTPEQARALAAKSMAAERQRATRTAQRNVALIGAAGWMDTRAHFDAVTATLGGWRVEQRAFEKETKEHPNQAALLELWNRGQDLILHAGHGNPGDWEQCISVRALPKLVSCDRIPVVFSAGCSTAYFAALAPYDDYMDADGAEHAGTDHGEVFTAPPPPPANYQRGKYNKTGLGEELVRMPQGGAVAYIGCNTGSQPCGLTLQRGFAAAVAGEHVRLGEAWNEALRFYHQQERLAELKPNASWYPPSIFFQGMKFMLFGDPSIEL
jgi:Peptidase family C25